MPYRAVRQAVSGALGVVEWLDGINDTPGAQGQYVQFVLPIVVTAAPLYECALDQGGAVAVTAVQHTALWVQPQQQRPRPSSSRS